MKMRSYRTFVFGLAVLGAAALPLAGGRTLAQGPRVKAPTQSAPPVAATAAEAAANPGYGHMNLTTRVGSFKLLGSETVPVTGALVLNFSGTVLVSGASPGTTVTLGGNVRREYETADKTKQVYFGTGKITLVGTVRAVQFFGRDLTARFDGVGIFRLFGEFDKKLDTGFYWFDGQTQKLPWGTSGATIVSPNPQYSAPKPRVRIDSGG
jgi:hypothetical protein